MAFSAPELKRQVKPMWSVVHAQGRLPVILAVAGGVAALGAWQHEALAEAVPRVASVEVVGAERSSDAGVRHLADIRVGQPLMDLDLDAAVAAVDEHPWVARSEIRRDLEGHVEIRVEEHQQALLLLVEEGLFRVSRGGEVFARAHTADLDHPLLTGLDARFVSGHPAIGQKVVHEAVELLDAVDGLAALDTSELSEIAFDADLGFTLRLRSGTDIHLGLREPVARLDRLERLVGTGLDLATPARVDLDLVDSAIVTPLPS